MSLHAILDPAKFAEAWRSIQAVEPADPIRQRDAACLISKWTRNGKVPTLAEAEAMENMDYIQQDKS